MTTIRFSAEEFEGVLTKVCGEYSLTFVKDGYRGNELRYHVPVKTLGRLFRNGTFSMSRLPGH
jgi:hypothetical protein